MEVFRLDQLTKELVTDKVRSMDDPCAEVAGIVKTTLDVAMRSAADDSKTRAGLIEDACRGGMTGLILTEQNTARGAVLILHRVVEIAARFAIDPMSAMEGALKGIASLSRVMQPDRVQAMYYAVQAEFMGAGDLLLKLLDQAERAHKRAAAA